MYKLGKELFAVTARLWRFGKHFPRIRKVIMSWILMEFVMRTLSVVIDLLIMRAKLSLVTMETVESEVFAYVEWLGDNKKLVESLPDKVVVETYVDLRVSATPESKLGQSVIAWQKEFPLAENTAFPQEPEVDGWSRV